MGDIWGILLEVYLFLQGIGDFLIEPMHWVTFLGDEEFYLLIMPVIYWCIDTQIGIRLTLVLMLANFTGTSFKFLFHTPRPFWVSQEVVMHVEETSFGMPSGHSLNAMALWGYASTVVKQKWIKILFWCVVFLIGFSRLILGVHFINDVLLGWLLGAVLLILFLRLENKFSRSIQNWSDKKKAIGIFLTGFILFAVPALIYLANMNYFPSESWLMNYQFALPGVDFCPYSLEGSVTVAATTLGLLLGLFILNKMGMNFSPGGPVFQRAARYIVGLIGVLFFWMGLKMIFPGGEDLIGLLFRFFRYTLIGLWLSFGAPYVFLKLKLASKAKG